LNLRLGARPEATRRRNRIFPTLLLAAGIAATATARPLRVVTTIPDLASIAAAIGGEAVSVYSISQGREDPHFLQARPTYVVRARDADLWIRAGMELEVGWEPLVVEQSRNRAIRPGRPGFLDGAAFVAEPLEVPTGPISRAQGDVHAEGNPHYLLDPLNARSVARGIGARLAELRPGEGERFREGTKVFVRELDERMFGAAALGKAEGDDLWERLRGGTLDAWLAEQGIEAGGWWARTAPFRGNPIATFHKSFTYFAHRFGLDVAIELEPVPGVPPSPAHLARVVETMQERNIGVLLMEPFYPRRPADFVARRTDARVAVVSSYSLDTAPDAWFRMMDVIVAALAGD